MGHAQEPAAEAFSHPDVAPAVDAKTATVEPDLEVLGLARISGGKPCDVVDAAISHPNPVLLINAEVKRRKERRARLGAIAFANDPTLGQIALGEMNQLALFD